MKIARWMIGALLVAAVAITVSFQLSPSRDHWPVAQAQPQAQPGEVTLTFLGTSTVLVSDGTTHLLTDGYFSRVSIPQLFGTIEPNQQRIDNALKQANISELDAIPVLHSHFDHAMDSPMVAQRTGAQLLGSASTAMVGRGGG
ncbi:MAG TPA: MBL fold metallo-hydrolase, partial [Alcanivorax sp.]|nr:MBL fold metallo-hydrolase [Alcanivorax sp.]